MKTANQETTRNVRNTAAPVITLKGYKPRALTRVCNLCDQEFHAHSKFERYCDKCRSESELYHFAEWLSA